MTEIETLLDTQMTRLSKALDATLDKAEEARVNGRVDPLCRELGHATALANALARLGGALARMRGQTQTIRIERQGASSSKGGSNGQGHRKS